MGIMTVLNSTLGSSLPSGAISYIAKDFNIVSKEQLALPISLFLLGYVFGPLLCGPMSEYCGRKPVTVVSFAGFMVLTLGCAVCRDWNSLLVLRFLVGITASAPISIVGGILADIYNDPRERGVIMSYCMTVRIKSVPNLKLRLLC
jgi:MFS family permease